MEGKILVTGALGQIGSELVPKLKKIYGGDNVISLDQRESDSPFFEKGDARDKEFLRKIIRKYDIIEIYHLVGILSAASEKDPDKGWNTNMVSLKNILDLSVELGIRKIFWPSSIAVFGPDAKKDGTPQDSALNPTTMYGVTKVAGDVYGRCNRCYSSSHEC